MADKGRDSSIIALEAVYAALKDMDAAGRRKVLSSAFALLGVDSTTLPSPTLQSAPLPAPTTATSSGRPIGLGELINEKKPGTNAQRIAIFAYYRERVEGISRFGRYDLKPYFAKAKLPSAGNYDRDFTDAARKGWIHEDGVESYLTTKGIEAIETGFEGERKYSTGRKNSKARKKRTAATKRRGARKNKR